MREAECTFVVPEDVSFTGVGVQLCKYLAKYEDRWTEKDVAEELINCLQMYYKLDDISKEVV